MSWERRWGVLEGFWTMRVEGQVATRALVEFVEVAEVAFASVEDTPKDVFGAAGVDALAFSQVVEPARAHHREAFHLSLCEAQAHPERHARWCVGMGSPVNLLLKLLHGRHGGCRSMQKARADGLCLSLACASKERTKKESSEKANRKQRQLCNETSCPVHHYYILSSRTTITLASWSSVYNCIVNYMCD